MPPVAAPADKRFRRSHVSPTRRASLRAVWPRLARIAAGSVLLVAGLYYGIDRVLSADSLTISNITVSGNSRMSRGEVVTLLDGLRGESMLSADLDAWRRKLLESPWVAEATIRRVFPGTLAVAVSERQPLGIARITDRLYLVDRRGMVIDEFGPNYAELDLPIIDGLAPLRPPDGSHADDARTALAGRLLSDLARRPDLARRVSQIDVSDPHDAAVILKDDTALVRVGEENFVDRLQSYLDLASALRERIPDIDYVDLRFDERVYVRPQGTGAKSQKAQKGMGG